MPAARSRSKSTANGDKTKTDKPKTPAKPRAKWDPKIVALLKKQPGITTGEVGKVLKFSNANKVLRRMESQGQVTREDTGWKVAEKK